MSEKNIQQSFWKKTKRFFEPVRDNKKVSLELFIHFFINAFSGVIFVLFIKRIMEALELGDVSSFNVTLIYFGVLYLIFQFIYFLVYKLGWTAAYNSYQKSIQNNYIPHYINFDNNYYENVGTGKSIAIISKGVKTWSELLDHLINELTRLFVVLGLSIYLISLIDSRLLVFLFLLLLLGQGFGLYMNSFMVAIRKKRILIDNLLGKHLVTIIMSKMEILQSGKIQLELKRLNKYNDKEIYYNIKMAPYLISFFSISHFIIFIILFATFYLFGNLYFKGEISLGLIAGLSSSILLMQNIFLDSLDFLKNFAKKFAEVQNLWDFFDNAPQIKGYEEGDIFQHKSGKISLKNINYSYDETKPVFQDFSLDIGGSKVTALVGPSGGGKTTLAKLISGYIRQDRGDILVDQQNLKEISLKSYYGDVGYLTQEPSVFDGSVRDNLLYAVGNTISDEQINKIITLAHCEFIYDFLNGLDTEIGERGVRLSGGQKQRLAIAKIFLKAPKIIILDEPTSALDSLSEQKITQAMHNLFKNRTVIVIAHRLQTVKYADDIVVIDGGKIVERGTHDILVEKKGFYKKMLDLQSGF